MKLLLDTHAFLWHADGSPQMSAAATALLVDPANELFLSMASVWEIAIKLGMKKLTISAPYVTFWNGRNRPTSFCSTRRPRNPTRKITG